MFRKYVGSVFARPFTARGAQTLDNSRYPFRLPDWLWQSAPLSELLGKKLVSKIELEIKILEELVRLNAEAEADRKEVDIIDLLSSSLSPVDLSLSASHITTDAGMSAYLVVDPQFSDSAAGTIKSAFRLFLDCALNEDIIESSYLSSTKYPKPAPEKYSQVGDSETELSPGYSRFARSRVRPESPSAFLRQLKNVLLPSSGMAPNFIISRYNGNAWWGGAYVNFYYNKAQRLGVDSNDGSYFYIRLNSDKLQDGIADFNDPKFWAGKIAHEALHNLGYWHPEFSSPEERDKYSSFGERAFIVGYELEMIKYLRATQ